MVKTVSIATDPVSLNSTIVFSTEDLNIVTQLRLIFISSNQADYVNHSIKLPWFELKKQILQIVTLFRNNQFDIALDELTTKLVRELIAERKSVSENKTIVGISEQYLSTILIEANFRRGLKPHQMRDCAKLLKLKNGANFSVPGAGKTATTLAVYCVLRHHKIVNKLFVVSPLNSFLSWEDEVKEIFSNALSTLRISAAQINNENFINSIDADVILVNYEKLRKNINKLYPFFLKNKIQLVLDESHRIKSGIANQSFIQIRKVSDTTVRRDILSGTPMPQSYEDLLPQFEFLWPSQDIIPRLDIGSEEFRIESLNKAISNYYVRTTKDELGLEDPVIRHTEINMGPIQAELYKLLKSETARIVVSMDRASLLHYRRLGKSVIKLLQAATNPMLLGSSDDYDEEIVSKPMQKQIWELLQDFINYEKPEKIEVLKNNVESLLATSPSKKLLIWSSFVRNIQILEKLFRVYNPVSIYGGVSTGSDDDERYREGRIRKFHEDNSCRIMIANPQACGEGISLHKVCHYAIYLDRTFNAAHYLQSVDRIHRLGLSAEIETNIELLICKNTIDEVVKNRLKEKILNMGRALNDKYLEKLAYDPEDIPVDEQDGFDSKDIQEIIAHVTN